MPSPRTGRETTEFPAPAQPGPPNAGFPDPGATGRGPQLRVNTPHEFRIPRPAAPGERFALTILSGVGAGRTFAIDRDRVTLGREEGLDVSIDDEAVSRRHARITRTPEGAFFLEDLDSTNGTFVQATPVRRARLMPGDRIHLGPHVALRFATTDEEEDTLRRRLYDASTRDALTGVSNRFAFLERVDPEIVHAQRWGVPLSLLMIDLDYFKRINDDLGHLIGDQVLLAVAQRMQSAVRKEDLLARYGGEEFLVLSRAADREAACDLAERVRSAVQSTQVGTRNGPVAVTVSIGVATLRECACPDAQSLLALADQRMYAAKRRGRNRVCADDPS